MHSLFVSMIFSNAYILMGVFVKINGISLKSHVKSELNYYYTIKKSNYISFLKNSIDIK